MNMSTVSIDNLHLKCKYNWDVSSISYLGIQLSYPSSKLYKVNYPNLLVQINKYFQKLQKLNSHGQEV